MTDPTKNKVVQLVLVEDTEDDPGPRPGATAMPIPELFLEEEELLEAVAQEWKEAA